ncbi:MAG: transglycosylase SLT domain-containing protein [Actinomycetota bacterium]
MIRLCLGLILLSTWNCYCQPISRSRAAAEYYLAAYAQHYGVPLDFARAVVEQESGRQACVRSPKGAVGIMQLMPETAIRQSSRLNIPKLKHGWSFSNR